MGESTNGVDDDCSGEPSEDGGSCENFRTDPVHVGTGAFISEPLVDVRFSGAEVPIEFVRVYNSRNGWPAPFDDANSLGVGWSHTFNEGLLVNGLRPTSNPPSWGPRTVVHRMSDGTGRAFSCPTWTPTNWYCTSSDSSTDVLTWDAGATEYLLTRGDGLVTRFHGFLVPDDARSGRVVSHRNRAGAGWTVNYVDATTGRIGSVTDHLLRSLTFVWTLDAGSTDLWRLTSLSTTGGATPATFSYREGGLYLGGALSVVGEDAYTYAETTYEGVLTTRPFLTSIVRGGRTIVSVAYAFDPTVFGGLGTGSVASITAGDGSYSFRWPTDARNTCAETDRTSQIVDRSTTPYAGSCTNDAAGDAWCATMSGLGTGLAVCDTGVCRAATCQTFAAGVGAGSVRYNEVINIDGNCPCGGSDTFTWAPTTSGPRRMTSRTARDGTITSYAYDTLGRLTTTCTGDTDTDASTCSTLAEWHALTYNATWGGLIATEQSRSRLSSNVITTTYTYDANALLVSVARQGYTYNSAGVVVLETQTTTYTRDAGNWGRVTSVTGPATGARTDFVYWPSGSGNSTGLLRYEREYFTASAYMETTYSNYTSLGYAQSIATPHNTTRTFTYSFSGQRLVAVNEHGLLTTLAYDGTSGRLATVTEPSGRILRFTYSSAPTRLTDVDFLDATSNTVFDTISFTYDAAGRRLTTRLHRGATDVYLSDATYDARGLMTSEGRGTLPNAVLTYDAAAMGYLEQLTRGDGDVLDPGGYDDFGRPGTMTRLFGGGPAGTHSLAYLPGSDNEVGDATPWLVTDPGSHGRSYTWDDFGHIVGAFANDWGGSMRYWYQQGRLLEEVRPDGRRTVYGYDDAGRVTNINNNAQSPTLYGPDYTFVYDDGTGGAPPCPTGNVTSCAYRRGRLARVTLEYATAQFWTMTYDYTPAGEVNFEGHTDGRFTRFERDATGRVSRVVLPTHANDSLRYVYDSTANNGLDQSEVIQVLGERWTTSWTSYLTWGTSIARDAAGRVTSVMAHDSPSGYPDVFTYATHGRLASMRVRRRASSSTAYDVVYRSPLTYSSDGELTGYDSLVTADADRTFRYDGANRLLCGTSVTGSATCPTASPLVESYVYDASDNRTSSRRLAGVTTVTLAENAVDALAPPGRTVDYINNAASGGSRYRDKDTTAGVLTNQRTYTYDGMDRLSGMSLYRPGPTSGSTQLWFISIAYDHRSRPIYVSARNNATGVESRYQYYYDLEDRLLGSITTPTATAPTTYTAEAYAHVSPHVVGTLRTSYVSGVGTDSFLYTTNDEVGLPAASYSFTRTGTITTALVWRGTYYPFGELLTSTGSGTPPPWRFHGQLTLPYSDASVWSGGVVTLLRPALHLNRWRVYDPFLGLYLQPEPLALLGSEHYTNAFGYAWGDPRNVIDPTGRAGEGVFGGPVVGVGVTVLELLALGFDLCVAAGICDLPFPVDPADPLPGPLPMPGRPDRPIHRPIPPTASGPDVCENSDTGTGVGAEPADPESCRLSRVTAGGAGGASVGCFYTCTDGTIWRSLCQIECPENAARLAEETARADRLCWPIEPGHQGFEH